MAFISVADEMAKKSFTSVENKFITKYLPVLEPVAVKIYLYSLYLYQNGQTAYTLCDMAQALNMSEDEVCSYFEYLEEFELVAIISVSPFEIKILDAENVYGTPKKFKPEKYSDFTKSVQNILKGRMISINEFREYFYLLEEYGFEQNALIMIINYCASLKGDNIRFQYIKKVAKSFADEGVTTAKKVDEKLSAYTSSTPALIKIFNAVGIKDKPDIDDDKLYKKWTVELGFNDEAIIAAAKHFKAKTAERIDAALSELFKNRKFDPKEIADYCKNKNSVYAATLEIARNLGIYMNNSAPYVENFVSVWCNMGYSLQCLTNLSSYCFKHGKKSFEDMSVFINKLYEEGIITDEATDEKIAALENEDKLLGDLLSTCGLTRRVIDWDRESLKRWRSWNFSDEMLFEAAKISSGKSNPTAYMNAVLSSWKNENIYSPDKINPAPSSFGASAAQSKTDSRELKSAIEKHFFDLRHKAEAAAESELAVALADEKYGKLHKEINDLSMQLAFAEVREPEKAEEIGKKIDSLNLLADDRLKQLKIDKSAFTPRYKCKICNDTGYDPDGKPCVCLEKFIASYNSKI